MIGKNTYNIPRKDCKHFSEEFYCNKNLKHYDCENCIFYLPKIRKIVVQKEDDLYRLLIDTDHRLIVSKDFLFTKEELEDLIEKITDVVKFNKDNKELDKELEDIRNSYEGVEYDLKEYKQTLENLEKDLKGFQEWVFKEMVSHNQIDGLDERINSLEEKDENFVKEHCRLLFRSILEDNKELKKRIQKLESIIKNKQEKIDYTFDPEAVYNWDDRW